MTNKANEHISKKIVQGIHKSTIQIPDHAPIHISAGTIPSSGATVAPQIISKEFKKAAQSKLIPPPQEFNLSQNLQ